MRKEFKPLEKIAEDESIGVGDLLLLKQKPGCQGHIRHRASMVAYIEPRFYGGLTTYEADPEKDEEEVSMMRFYECFEELVEERVSGFSQTYLLIELSHASSYEYAVMAKAEELPMEIETS